jgi:hypothetical protein
VQAFIAASEDLFAGILQRARSSKRRSERRKRDIKLRFDQLKHASKVADSVLPGYTEV